MEVIDVKISEDGYYRRDETILTMLLKKHLNNDDVFENSTIDIVTRIENPFDYIYRKLWETMYLRRDMSIISRKSTNGMYIIKMSFAEAISYIHAVTPPVFQPRVDELTESVDIICDILKHYLIEKNDQLQYHLSIFKKLMHIEYFETHTNYDINRTDILRKYSSSGIIIDVEVCDCSFNDMYNGNVSSPISVMVMVNCNTKKEISEIIDIIERNDSKKWRIINAFKNDDIGYFIECFTRSYDSESSKLVQEIITKTYKPIMTTN